jgi:hypothetical protein
MTTSNVLAVTRKILRGLSVLNGLYGIGILLLLIASYTATHLLFTGLGVRLGVEGSERIVRGARFIMLVGIASVPVTHAILDRLRLIVDTVREGDPFVVANAERLTTIAWRLLALEGLHLLVGVIAANSASSVQPLDIQWSFSGTPFVAALLTFVLARVFDQGARMRADLQGTV